jgi:hypothetical protein
LTHTEIKTRCNYRISSDFSKTAAKTEINRAWKIGNYSILPLNVVAVEGRREYYVNFSFHIVLQVCPRPPKMGMHLSVSAGNMVLVQTKTQAPFQ